MGILKTTLIGLFFGTFGTTLGGIIGIIFKKPSNKLLSFILSLAGGLMTAILSFDLIPEALKISSVINVLLGIIFGIISMMICNIIVDKKFNNSQYKSNKKEMKNDLLKAGIITSIGLAIHNFPEGLAIGSGFGASLTLGYSLAIAICIHDIPERNINGNADEKWRNEYKKSTILRNIIWNNNWSRSIFWQNNRRHLRKNNSYMPFICSRSNVIYSFRRISARVK